jgi:Stress responsive A/B Barrel Domain
MRKQLVIVAAVVVLMGGFLTLNSRRLNSRLEAEAAKAAANAPGSLLSHDVYFTLKDESAAAKKKLVAACKKYLAKHPGEVFFAAGTRAEDLKREVNDQDFDVALHIVFQSQADQDRYQEAPRHLQFIAENKENWKKVRVFDSVVQR